MWKEESKKTLFRLWHYNDVIMGAIASQITSLKIVYSIVYSAADQRKRSLAFVRGINGGNVSIWWRHHEFTKETPYLALLCELWGVFSEFSREKIPRDIESALYLIQVTRVVHNIPQRTYDAQNVHMTSKWRRFEVNMTLLLRRVPVGMKN